MHLPAIIRDLAVILGVAGVVSLLFQRIRQPVVLGYIVAGLIVGPYTPPSPLVSDIPNIRIWAELGVIFLMFTLGLEFSFRKLAQVGVSAGATALIEVAVMVPLGYATGRLLGWTPTDALFLGAMLSVSSTTIIIKALDELGLKTRRFAQLIFAVLIVEDLLAILLLVGLGTVAGQGGVSGLGLLSAGAKLALVVSGWFVAGYFAIPGFLHYVGRRGTTETLTILSLGLCLALVVFAAHFEYSVALGAFIMGSIIAESRESRRVEELMHPLRDLFAAVFFVSVGMLIDPRALWSNRGAVAAVTVVTIVGKVLSTGLGALATGQGVRTSIQVGFGLAQIGEFSFIIAGLGTSLGVTSDFVYPVAVAVSILTTFTTPYLIRFSERAAQAAERRLPERARAALEQYAAWSQERRGDSERRRQFNRLLLRWLIAGVVVSVVFVLASEALVPWLGDRLGPRAWLKPAGGLLAIAVSAPFLWAMFSLFKGRGESLLMRLLSVAWVGALSSEFIPGAYAFGATLLALGALSAVFYRRLESSYHWFERRFARTFEAGEAEEKDPRPSGERQRLEHLAPWDAHLVRLRVHPNAALAGKSLAEARLRNDFGVNIVAIERGEATQVAPSPAERLFPADELEVLGTDEQIDRLRPLLERGPDGLAEADPRARYELRRVAIEPGSPWAGRTIRDSGIRERFSSMVVGLEREGRRVPNPDTDQVLAPGDVLWVVGPDAGLERMARLEAR